MKWHLVFDLISKWVFFRYELLRKRTCPYAYADEDDPVTIECTPGPLVSEANGDILSTNIRNLQPFTRYEFLLQVRNEGGSVKNASNTAIAVTLPARMFGFVFMCT